MEIMQVEGFLINQNTTITQMESVEEVLQLIKIPTLTIMMTFWVSLSPAIPDSKVGIRDSDPEI